MLHKKSGDHPNHLNTSYGCQQYCAYLFITFWNILLDNLRKLPTRGDHEYLHKLVEIFQPGLSWLTISQPTSLDQRNNIANPLYPHYTSLVLLMTTADKLLRSTGMQVSTREKTLYLLEKLEPPQNRHSYIWEQNCCFHLLNGATTSVLSSHIPHITPDNNVLSHIMLCQIPDSGVCYRTRMALDQHRYTDRY